MSVAKERKKIERKVKECIVMSVRMIIPGSDNKHHPEN
jgi:hypothetical protein